jgi:hypothetical protein
MEPLGEIFVDEQEITVARNDEGSINDTCRAELKMKQARISRRELERCS